MKHIPITIGIVTKNRTPQLSLCIDSICNQQLFPSDQLVIVDNSSDNSTNHLVSHIKKEKKLKATITYTHDPLSNLPLLRNQVLKKSINNWVVYIDDDCIAHPKWISEIQRSIFLYPHAAIITGAAYAINRSNVYSITTEINELYWKSQSRQHNSILNFEATDNKNIICNLNFFSHNHISYDKKLVLFYGCSEDCDLGRQIQRAGGEGYYNASQIIYHNNVTAFLTYFYRLFMRLGGNYGYSQKWRMYDNKRQGIHVMKIAFLSTYFRTNKYSYLFRLQVVLLLVTTFIYIRFVKLFMYCYYRVRQ